MIYSICADLLVVIARMYYSIEKSVSLTLFQSHGVPQFFGIYYAMGIALIIEGFMSSFYHICPSNANFQFGEQFSLYHSLQVL